ncbi:MAG: tRNA (5-methylaminomethyl-2-thiouridine)(34)-methyltransferase MnmD [Paracoccaceae bacterium]
MFRPLHLDPLRRTLAPLKPRKKHERNTVQNPEIEWLAGDVPLAKAFDDPYFSRENGPAETAHVFLAGNGLPGRFDLGFHIAELGFGTGLNALMAGQAWAAFGCAGRLDYTSFEAFPLGPAATARALCSWEFPDKAALLAGLEAGKTRIQTASLNLRLVLGDARQTLPNEGFKADAWFLDGFSPAKNPALWAPELLVHVARCTVPHGSFASYTAAGHVRRALTAAGFEVSRIPGFGRKKHMICGRLRAADESAQSE